jgi:Ca2+-binding EF-hand superfamily protein
MVRALSFVAALALLPAGAAAQQPCTGDARQVVNELYRHMLERTADRGSDRFVQQLNRGTTVREVVREIAKSPEHTQRFVPNTGADGRRVAVTNLFRHVLGRQPDPIGLDAHANGLAAQGAGAVVDSMVNSDEYTASIGDFGVPGSPGLRYCGGSGQTSSTPDNRSRFAGMDTNGDGIINRREWRGSAQAFAGNDWNSDGVLSGEEVRPGAFRTRDTVGTSGTLGDLNSRAFDALDRNGNNRLERNEWNRTAAEFDTLDANGNNVLSRAEVVADAASTATGNNALSREFNELDTTGDGRLSIQEWNWNRRTFDQQDANGDGFVTLREFTGAPAGTNNFGR